MVDIIRKKRDGLELSDHEIGACIDGIVSGSVPDYQISAFLMAVYFQDMSESETVALTDAMMHSGEVLDLSQIPGPKIDKHSTGGVGDKVSIVLAPLAASLGIKVPMISGRGLGHTGGTLDKLEAIPGFRVDLSVHEFLRNVGDIGECIAGQTAEMAPADGKMYALRDVTATVDSIPLIAASIMSKKLAEGADGLVLDVKTGNGAFMDDLGSAVKLAETMVDIGAGLGRRMAALVTDMSQPVGRMVGNAAEIAECVETLQGRGPDDLVELVVALASKMAALAEMDLGRSQILSALSDGRAFEKFKLMVERQGGDVSAVENLLEVGVSPHAETVASSRTGWVTAIDTRQVGVAAMALGAGRRQAGAAIDHSVGLEVLAKLGDRVEPGQPLVKVSYRDRSS